MKIAIISDTHDKLENLRKALNFIKKNKIEKIIHCGDVSKSSTLEFILSEFKKEVFLAFGNAEINKEKMKEENKKFPHLKIFEGKGEIEVDKTKIGFCHLLELGRKPNGLNEDFFFYGHTHKPWIKKIGDCFFANPGNLAGSGYQPTFAVLDTKTKKLGLKILSRL